MTEVLFVCTGNICRSPAAAKMLSGAVDDGDQISASSAGLSAVVGAGVALPVVRQLGIRGLDTTGFAARNLEPHMVRSADLVLTMTREQRSAVARIEPLAVPKLFTLREFARLSAALDLADYPDPTTVRGKRLMWLVDQAALTRSAPRSRNADDIADPFGGSTFAYRRAVRDIERGIAAITRLIAA